MKTLIIFYSYGGSTRTLATALAHQYQADLVEVRDKKRPTIVGAFMRCPAAMAQQLGEVQPFEVNFTQYDKIIVMGPIWAGHPAPPVNNIFAALPRGTQVEVQMVSSGGSSKREDVIAHQREAGVEIISYTDVRMADAKAAKP